MKKFIILFVAFLSISLSSVAQKYEYSEIFGGFWLRTFSKSITKYEAKGCKNLGHHAIIRQVHLSYLLANKQYYNVCEHPKRGDSFIVVKGNFRVRTYRPKFNAAERLLGEAIAGAFVIKHPFLAAFASMGGGASDEDKYEEKYVLIKLDKRQTLKARLLSAYNWMDERFHVIECSECGYDCDLAKKFGVSYLPDLYEIK